MREKSKNLILIDGHALAYRSFFALERTGMKTSDGQPTWAVYGFFKAFFDILKKHHPDAISVSFDCSRHTFRTDVFKEYKANRESMPDTMRSQMEFLFEGLEALDIPIYKKENFEADDIIGTIATKAKEAGHHAFILTGDRDSFQLVDKEGFIKILIPSSFNGLEEYDTEKVFTKMEVYPEQIIDYKALSGDSSDNIPGVKGIGHKTAVKLLGEYKTLENIYQNIDQITQKAVKQKLIDGEEIAKMSKFLATIDKNVDINFDFEKACLTMPKAEKVADFFRKLQFYSFLRQIDSLLLPFGETQTPCEEHPSQEIAKETTPQKSQLSLFGVETTVQEPEREIKLLHSNQNKFKKIISTKQDFNEFFEEFKDINLFSLDTETTGLDTLSANLVGIAIAYDKNFVFEDNSFKITDGEPETKSFYIAVGHKEGQELEFDYVIEKLKPILESPQKIKILQNAKYEVNIFHRCNINLDGIKMDTMLASYVKNPTFKHGLKQQALSLLNFEMQSFEELTGKGKKMQTVDNLPINDVGCYACDDAFATLELGKFYHLNLDEKQKNLHDKIELPLMFVLAYMERTGVHIDTNYLKELSCELQSNLEVIEAKIYSEAGQIFNINSPKQVAEILFDKMNLPGKKKTKTGYSTSADILENLAKDYEIAKLMLEQRHLTKLKTTYIDALPQMVNPVDNRIHTSFNQTITATGRLSSSNPNLQNIPIRTPLGNRIRACFTPEDQTSSLIISADYSQIELRLLAHFSKDEHLINAFNNDIDIHTATASKVFDVPVDEVTKDMRRKAKAVNFGIVYGQSSFGLSEALGITPFEAREFIDKYFDTYPKVKQFMDSTKEFAHQHGYVETMYGRRRYLGEELSSRNRNIREFAERAAINTPLQGSAADLIKLAMIDVYDRLKNSNLSAKMILQVHDELVFEISKNKKDELIELVKKSMELNQPLDVPLVVDFQQGSSWMETDEEPIVV